MHAHQIKELVSEHPNIKGIQCVITRIEQRDMLTMKIAASKPFSAEEIDGFLKKAREKIKVKVDSVVFVPLNEVEGKPIFDDQREWD